MIAVDEPRAAPAPPRRRRWLLAGAAVGVVAVGAWLAVGLSVSLAPGSYSQQYDLRAATDGFTQTRYVASDGAGRLGVSVRNDGRVPVTLRAPAVEAFSLHEVLGFRLLRPEDAFDLGADLQDSVRLAPGEQAGVLLALALPPCSAYGVGDSATLTTVPLAARSLGLRSDLDLVLPLPVTLLGPVVPAPDCPRRQR